jgi:hypothetical protein
LTALDADPHGRLESARRRRRVEWRWQIGAFLGIVATIEISFLVVYRLMDRTWTAVAIVIVAIALAMWTWRRHNHIKEFAAVELSRLHTVATIEAQRQGPDPVVIHRRSLDLSRNAPFLGIALGAMSGSAFSAAVLGPILVLIYVLLFPQQPVGRSPLLVLRRDGIEFAHLRLTLPWSALGHAYVASEASGAPVVRWHVLDPESAMAGSRLGAYRRNRALKRIRGAGGTIDIPSTWMREPPEVALAASWRLAGGLGTGVLD